MYNVWLKKTRCTKLVPDYFTFHDDTDIKARLIQNNKSCNNVCMQCTLQKSTKQNHTTTMTTLSTKSSYDKLAPYGTDGRLTFLPSSESCDTETRINFKNPARSNLDIVP